VIPTVCFLGKESELKGELVGHTGGIYGLAWDGSSRKLLSASGDKTCRLQFDFFRKYWNLVWFFRLIPMQTDRDVIRDQGLVPDSRIRFRVLKSFGS
jgi:hypothetical protein